MCLFASCCALTKWGRENCRSSDKHSCISGFTWTVFNRRRHMLPVNPPGCILGLVIPKPLIHWLMHSTFFPCNLLSIYRANLFWNKDNRCSSGSATSERISSKYWTAFWLFLLCIDFCSFFRFLDFSMWYSVLGQRQKMSGCIYPWNYNIDTNDIIHMNRQLNFLNFAINLCSSVFELVPNVFKSNPPPLIPNLIWM